MEFMLQTYLKPEFLPFYVRNNLNELIINIIEIHNAFGMILIINISMLYGILYALCFKYNIVDVTYDVRIDY